MLSHILVGNVRAINILPGTLSHRIPRYPTPHQKGHRKNFRQRGPAFRSFFVRCLLHGSKASAIVTALGLDHNKINKILNTFLYQQKWAHKWPFCQALLGRHSGSVQGLRFRAGPYLKRTPFPCRAFLGLSFDDDWAFLGLSFAPPPGGQKRGRL